MENKLTAARQAGNETELRQGRLHAFHALGHSHQSRQSQERDGFSSASAPPIADDDEHEFDAVETHLLKYKIACGDVVMEETNEPKEGSVTGESTGAGRAAAGFAASPSGVSSSPTPLRKWIADSVDKFLSVVVPENIGEQRETLINNLCFNLALEEEMGDAIAGAHHAGWCAQCDKTDCGVKTRNEKEKAPPNGNGSTSAGPGMNTRSGTDSEHLSGSGKALLGIVSAVVLPQVTRTRQIFVSGEEKNGENGAASKWVFIKRSHELRRMGLPNTIPRHRTPIVSGPGEKAAEHARCDDDPSASRLEKMQKEVLENWDTFLISDELKEEMDAEELDCVKTACAIIGELMAVVAAATRPGAKTRLLSFALTVDKGELAAAYLVAAYVVFLQRTLTGGGHKLLILLNINNCKIHMCATSLCDSIRAAVDYSGQWKSLRLDIAPSYVQPSSAYMLEEHEDDLADLDLHLSHSKHFHDFYHTSFANTEKRFAAVDKELAPGETESTTNTRPMRDICFDIEPLARGVPSLFEVLEAEIASRVQDLFSAKWWVIPSFTRWMTVMKVVRDHTVDVEVFHASPKEVAKQHRCGAAKNGRAWAAFSLLFGSRAQSAPVKFSSFYQWKKEKKATSADLDLWDEVEELEKEALLARNISERTKKHNDKSSAAMQSLRKLRHKGISQQDKEYLERKRRLRTRVLAQRIGNELNLTRDLVAQLAEASTSPLSKFIVTADEIGFLHDANAVTDAWLQPSSKLAQALGILRENRMKAGRVWELESKKKKAEAARELDAATATSKPGSAAAKKSTPLKGYDALRRVESAALKTHVGFWGRKFDCS
eukprot:g13540.t1